MVSVSFFVISVKVSLYTKIAANIPIIATKLMQTFGRRYGNYTKIEVSGNPIFSGCTKIPPIKRATAFPI